MFHSSLIVHDQPVAVIHPAEAALDFPALAVTLPVLIGRPRFGWRRWRRSTVGMVGLTPRRRSR